MKNEPHRIGGMVCPICESDNLSVLFEIESPYIEEISYNILHCADCMHRHAVGPLSDEILNTVYSAAFHSTSQQQADSPSSAVRLNAHRRVEWLVEHGIKGKLLDVGAGRGYFVKEAKDFFEARGIDYSSDAENYGNLLGVDLDSGDFLKASYPPATFDLLTFWDVLASMQDVHAVIARTADLLSTGGYAVFTVPMGDSLVCRLSGKYWPLWIPPVNLHYFSDQSLELIFQENGLDVVHMECQAKRVAIDFLILKIARCLGFRWSSCELSRAPFKWSVPINLGDIKTVLVRKA
jgi:hypothetical protein